MALTKKELEEDQEGIGLLLKYPPPYLCDMENVCEGRLPTTPRQQKFAKMNIGSVGKDEDGQFKDAGVGACAEVIAVSYLLDPNNHPEG